MCQQPGGLVDDDMGKAARGEDLIHHWAAAARVEYVTFEEKQSHARTPHREPHCYTYSNRQVVLRPNDWPIS